MYKEIFLFLIKVKMVCGVGWKNKLQRGRGASRDYFLRFLRPPENKIQGSPLIEPIFFRETFQISLIDRRPHYEYLISNFSTL